MGTKALRRTSAPWGVEYLIHHKSLQYILAMSRRQLRYLYSTNFLAEAGLVIRSDPIILRALHQLSRVFHCLLWTEMADPQAWSAVERSSAIL